MSLSAIATVLLSIIYVANAASIATIKDVKDIPGDVKERRQENITSSSSTKYPPDWYIAIKRTMSWTDCHEDANALFFFRLKRDDTTIPLFQTCAWLAERDLKQSICDENTQSWNDGSSITGPARDVCMQTCGTCYLMHPSQTPSGTPSPSSWPSGKLKLIKRKLSNTPQSDQPSDILSASPTLHPSSWPTVASSVSPSMTLSSRPTLSASTSPTRTPSFFPTTIPTERPTNIPTAFPSTSPTVSPTTRPSSSPSATPTSFPSFVPTSEPSVMPTTSPTTIPSVTPSQEPSNSPTSSPSVVPTNEPSAIPSKFPTPIPSTRPSFEPSFFPTVSPTMIPSLSPTGMPTSTPTYYPTQSPSSTPTRIPSLSPSNKPSSVPSPSPTSKPSTSPTYTPTSMPSISPTLKPSALPSQAPSSLPTDSPTVSLRPSAFPTVQPTSTPSASPTNSPSRMPSKQPSVSPTLSPSTSPSYSLQELEFFLVFQFDDLTEIPGKAITELEKLTSETIKVLLERNHDDVFDVSANVKSQAPFDFGSQVSNRKLDEKRRLQAIGLEVGVEVYVDVRSAKIYEQDQTKDDIAEAFDTEDERRAFFNELQIMDSSFRRINAMEITINNDRVELNKPATGASWVYIGSGIGVGAVTVAAFLLINARRRRREESIRSVAIPNAPPNVDARVATIVEVDAEEPADMSTLGDPFYGGPTGMFSAAQVAFVQQDDDPSNASNELSGGYDYKMAYGGAGDMRSVSTAEVKSAPGTRDLDSRVQSLDSSKVSKVSDDPDAISIFNDDDSFEKMYGEEEVIEINAPSGKLGVVIDNPVQGAPMVHAIRETSVLSKFIRIGDKLISVDGEDTTEMSAIQVSKLISSKSMNPRRHMVFLRPTAPY